MQKLIKELARILFSTLLVMITIGILGTIAALPVLLMPDNGLGTALTVFLTVGLVACLFWRAIEFLERA